MAKRPMYLQHVNIYVRDVERSKEWYTDLLGLHEYEYRPGWAAFLSADEEQSHEVALMQLGADAPLQAKGQVGLNHMAWRLESLDDLKEFYQRIKAKGQPIEHISDHGISLGIYMRDPDGNGVEVFYELPRSEWGVDYHIFSRDKSTRGRFPGPWDTEIRGDGPATSTPAPQPVAAE
jgi:catechol 2,3-dioxygenase